MYTFYHIKFTSIGPFRCLTCDLISLEIQKTSCHSVVANLIKRQINQTCLGQWINMQWCTSCFKRFFSSLMSLQSYVPGASTCAIRAAVLMTLQLRIIKWMRDGFQKWLFGTYYFGFCNNNIFEHEADLIFSFINLSSVTASSLSRLWWSVPSTLAGMMQEYTLKWGTSL